MREPAGTGRAQPGLLLPPAYTRRYKEGGIMEQIRRGLYRLQIQLPQSPLKTLNCYIMVSDGRNLIVDTGFNRPECLEALQAGIEALGLDMGSTDVLATHFHADHTGLISQIISDSSRVYMGRTDRLMFIQNMTRSDEYWRDAEERFRREGYPEQELAHTRLANPARKFTSSGLFDIVPLDEGAVLPVGDLHWTVISTPGHTPGHICLYEPAEKLLITGDHLLFDITPNIAWWKVMEDSLGSYLGSLHKVSAYEVEQVLPGHRGIEGSLQRRVGELLEHHENRLGDVMEIVRQEPRLTGYEIAARMKWSIRAKNWGEFPPGQRWFAVGEAVAHIEHLILGGRLTRVVADGIHRYVCADQGN